MTYGGMELKAAPIPGLRAAPAPRKAPKSPSKARSKRRTVRSKAPCKYGPRGPDGYCPKKPRATFTEAVTAKSLGISTKTRGRQTVGDKVLRHVEREAVSTTVKQGKQLLKGAAEEFKAQGGTGALAGAFLKPIGTVGAASVSASMALAAAAGLAAYFATTAVMKRIKAAKDQKQAAKNALADAYRQTRLDTAAKLGRPLTAAEQKELAAAFKEGAAQLGWRW